MKKTQTRCRAVLLAAPIALAIAQTFAAEPDATRTQAPTVEVIGTTPLPGLGVARDRVPANVQTATEDDLRVMAHAVSEAVRAGAMGFSTSRASTHETPDSIGINEIQTLTFLALFLSQTNAL